MSYTGFDIKPLETQLIKGNLITTIKVTNTGNKPGKEIVFLFVSCPEGKIKKEKKRLIGYAKTQLLMPGESQTLTIKADLHLLESYHAGTSSYYMEQGEYYILYGTSAEDENHLVTLTIKQTVTMQELDNICPLLDALKEIRPSKEIEDRWRANYANAIANVQRIALDEYLEKSEPVIIHKDDIRSQAENIRNQLSLEEKAFLCCGKQQGNDNEIVGNASG